MRQEDRDYHSERAQAELDRAHGAARPEAAEAHRRLSFLHMKCLQQDDERCDGAGLGTGR